MSAISTPVWGVSPVAKSSLVFVLAFALCQLGILTRPVDFFASFWPANAALLGLFLRFPRLSTPGTWIAAFCGYLFADVVSGGSSAEIVTLAMANFVGIGLAYGLVKMLGYADRGLATGMAVALFLGAAAVGSLSTALVGAQASAWFNGRLYSQALLLWFSSELTNYATITPVLLCLPTNLREHLHHVWEDLFGRVWDRKCYQRFFALMLLLCLSYASHLFGGPGAFVFPLPALILVASLFSLSTSCIIVLVYSLWSQGAFFLDLVQTSVEPSSALDIFSVRMGITLVGLSPLAMASMNMARESLLIALDNAATRDGLTGVLNRRAFVQRAQTNLAQVPLTDPCTIVLMLDVDHFKAINDTYGHAGGDEALIALAAVVSRNLRVNDLFGRLGGEEFGIIAHVRTPDDAVELGHRLVQAIEHTPIRLSDGTAVAMTISAGGIVWPARCDVGVEEALRLADTALYTAKHSGRNQAVIRHERA